MWVLLRPPAIRRSQIMQAITTRFCEYTALVNFEQTHPSPSTLINSKRRGKNHGNPERPKTQRVRGLCDALFEHADNHKRPGIAHRSTPNGGRVDEACRFRSAPLKARADANGGASRRPPGSGYRAKTTIGLRVPGVVETTVGANSSPVLIALCIASQNASSIFSCVARTRSSSIVNSSLIGATPAQTGKLIRKDEGET